MLQGNRFHYAGCAHGRVVRAGFVLLLFLADRAFTQTNVYPYIKGNHFANFPPYTGTPAAQPAKNNCVADPFYGSTVCKAIDVAEIQPLNPAVSVIRPSYMRWTNFNADQSKYFVYINAEIPVSSGKGQMRIYNTADNSFYDSPPWNSHENNDERWDDSDPNTLYYENGCTFNGYNIVTRASTLLRNLAVDFPGCQSIWNGVEGAPSIGTRYWTWMVRGAYAHGGYPLLAIVVYDKQTNSLAGILNRALYIAQGGMPDAWDSYGFGPNMVDMAPSGDRVLLLWPSVKYPSPTSIYVGATNDMTIVTGTQATVSHGLANGSWAIGDSYYLSGCSGGGAGLNGVHAITAKPSTYSTVFDVTGSGVAAGSYKCIYIQPAITSIDVAGGVATAHLGFGNVFHAGDALIISGAPISSLNGIKAVLAASDARWFTFSTTAADGTYTAGAGKGMVVSWQEGVAIRDNDFRFPWAKPNNNVASDGPHVYNLNFSSPVKVCNDETHSGWSWTLTGDPAFLCQINNANWAVADPDSVGFTDIYTGVYTPVFYHSDLFYQAGWHFGRIYDTNIRGWGAAIMQAEPGDTNALTDTLFFFELKKWDQQPRIWRALKTHNTHYGYDTEGHGNLSRDGLNLIWGANWNASSSSGSVNTYTSALPPNWWVNLTPRFVGLSASGAVSLDGR
jgi:hypothetical protein